MGSYAWLENAKDILARENPNTGILIKQSANQEPFIHVTAAQCVPNPISPYSNAFNLVVTYHKTQYCLQVLAFNGSVVCSEWLDDLLESTLISNFTSWQLCPGVPWDPDPNFSTEYHNGIAFSRHQRCGYITNESAQKPCLVCDPNGVKAPIKEEKELEGPENLEHLQPQIMGDVSDNDDEDDNEAEEKNESLDQDRCVKRRKKSSQAKISCSKCQTKYASESALSNHNCIGVRPRSCPICLIQVKLSCKYDMHLKIHAHRFDLNQSISCPKCDVKVSKLEMTDHFHSNHDRTRTCCVECLKIVPNAKMYNHFHGSHNQAKDKLCTLCGKNFRDRPMLSVHMAVAHNIGVEEAVCDFCGRSYPHRYLMLKHINMVHKGRTGPQACQTCGKIFETLPKLSKHLKLHTKYKCNLCDDYLNGKLEAVHRHLEEVHQTEPFEEHITKLENTDIASKGRNKRATKKEMIQRKTSD